MNFIFGPSGQLGSEFSHQLKGDSTVQISRETLQNFARNGLKRSLMEFFTPYMEEQNQIILALGEVNPGASDAILRALNVEIPMEIIESLNFENFRFVTLGTIHERSDISNPYIDSKKSFYNLVSSVSLSCELSHFRLHTIYSNLLPKSSMFLGQVYLALKHNQEMKMSSGMQFREYHHVSEIVPAILGFHQDLKFHLVEVTSGDPIRLKDLATGVFEHFKKRHLLTIQENSRIEGEIYEGTFSRGTWLQDFDFSEPLPGVISALSRHV